MPEGKTAKNRKHINIRVGGEPPWHMAEGEELIRRRPPNSSLLATTVRGESYGAHLRHVAMLDPGNEFCVA